MLPVLPFLLGSITGISGYKLLQEKMKDEEFKKKVESLALEVSDLWKKALNTSGDKFEILCKTSFKKLKSEIKAETKYYEEEKREKVLRNISNIKKESGYSLEGVGKMFKLYISILNDNINNGYENVPY